MPMSKKLAAESIGTFWIVHSVCGRAVPPAVLPEVGIGLWAGGPYLPGDGQ